MEMKDDGRKVFYLQHHPIIGKKLRVVFYGSFADSEGTSLNARLHIGSPIQLNLFAICLRFRFHRFVFTADIVKMFRQVWVSENHRNFQRILWREGPDEELKHFQLCTVTYGTASAPFLVVRVLEQIAKDHGETHPDASRILMKDFYVDDVVTGASSEAELLHYRNELVHLLSLCGIELSKWMTNVNSMNEAETTNCKELDLLKLDEEDSAKILGIHWNSAEDTIRYKVKMNDYQLRVSRFVVHSGEIHLHGFCDASSKAYSAVVHCRTKDENDRIHVSVIASKTRVAPLKQISLPR
ncbi:uncharacterized protein LOC142225006 [Haematobia irritans]|uniref:uncharacterized protein LOC142225006 n=1 Tax=Haematobia irritans TaxID=7368 RepID=UPI003F4FA92C